MNIVLLQNLLSEQEIRQLTEEFPDHLFLTLNEQSIKNLENEGWNQVEIIYGNQLSPQQLKMATHLRWIHSPSPNISGLCLEGIQNKENIIITVNEEVNTFQIAEYVFAGILSFAKNLFYLKEDKTSKLEKNNQNNQHNKIWTLPGKSFLQIGLGNIGSAITEQAKLHGLKVFGVQSKKTFHPYCENTLKFEEINSVLPAMDIVSIALPRSMEDIVLFDKHKIELMKNDSILLVIGNTKVIDLKALSMIATTGKFRGVIIDTNEESKVVDTSPLYHIPNSIITCGVSHQPETHEDESFHIFRYNFRQFIHNNFGSMKNVWHD